MPRDGGRRVAFRLLRRRWALLAALLVTLLWYLPYLGKGFVSEDFVLIALLREVPPWRDLAGTFGGPWLGARLFSFYRPVATLVFGAEAALFGGRPFGYNLVHVVVHLGATALAWRLALSVLGPMASVSGGRRLRVAAGVAALFFGLYPLAPNSVLFAASFANLFGAAVTLGAAVLYLKWREGGGSPRVLAAAVAVFALALGCYESAAALPAWVALYEVTRPGLRARWRRSAVGVASFALPGAAYLWLRATLLGEVLGGYGDVAGRLRSPELELAVGAVRSLLRLPSPWFGPAPGPRVEVVAALALGVAAAVWIVAGRGRPAAGARLRAFVLGVGWAGAFLAPFAFRLVVPANGRYWVLPAAGVAVALAVLVERALAGSRLPAIAAMALVGVLLARNGWFLTRHLGWMDRAAATATRIADQVEPAAGASPGPVLVTGYPLFLRDAAGTRLAQVYHYGLRAALGPPFREPARDVYPLPSPGRADLGRVATVAPVWRWVEGQRRLERLELRPAALPPELAVTGPPDGARVDPSDPSELALRVPAPAGARLRLVVVTPGNFHVAEGRLRRGGEGLALDGRVLRLWGRFQPGPQLWWVERLGRAGEVLATSRPRWLNVDVPGIGIAAAEASES
ncbi:MAG: hypothetical protein ACLF0P_08725 [Thermoanaerobaculia bacterium]